MNTQLAERDRRHLGGLRNPKKDPWAHRRLKNARAQIDRRIETAASLTAAWIVADAGRKREERRGAEQLRSAVENFPNQPKPQS